MPANQRQQTVQNPASPTSKLTSKYTNKDGSKSITVPKGHSITESSETSPAMAQTIKANSSATGSTDLHGVPAINRKKQKRREKEAAKRLAAGQPANLQAQLEQSAGEIKKQMAELEARFREHGLDEHYDDPDQFDPAEGDPYYSDEADVYSGSYDHNGSPVNGYAVPPTTNGKKSRKKKKSKGAQSQGHEHLPGANGSSHEHVSLPLPPLATNMPRGPGISKEKIWNTSSQEERERIKEFWLSLGEDERKSLVKVEKDAVLKKMKEQQKHSCSCTVCGRKRTAIEEELEVLYDAYYEELEQYANHQGDGGPPIMPPRRFGAISGLQPPNRLPPAFNNQQPHRGRIVEQLPDDEDEEGDEEYSEDDGEEDEYSDDEPEELPRSHATDFFNFGNSLTVQGGILTVADDLLKNDGKKFIEMMEQLAERRMAREEDAREQFANPNYGHPLNGGMHPHSHAHNHPPPPDDDEYDDEEEDEEDYDSQDEEYDEEEMDTMTEEQRMEEGRRMFQIFAARMFEQRVLTAYKKKVSEERTQRLLEELEEENKAQTQKQAKKARDAQKKKEKLAQKKQALAEEKAKRESEEAERLAAIRAEEEKKTEAQRMKAEEKRKKKEAQKKAEEEERLRKEAEKQRRLQEQRDRQAELERKQRESKEKERKEKEEQRQREREAKEAKDREMRERKEKQEREKRERELSAKAERELKESQKREEIAASKVTPQVAIPTPQTTKRPSIPVPSSIPHPVASPHIPVAIPAITKAPTPTKLQTSSSQQGSNSSVPQTPQTSAMSQNESPVSAMPIHESPGPGGAGKPQVQNQIPNQAPFLHQPQAHSPIHAALKSPPGIIPHPNSFNGLQSMNGMSFPPGMPMAVPGYGGRMDPMYSQGMGAPFRPHAGPGSMPMPMGMHQMPQGRGFPLQHAPPGFPSQIPNGLGMSQSFGQKDVPPTHGHSRQQSASFEAPGIAPAQPIARPAPIGRPSSVVHGHHHGELHNEIEDLSNHLGSSALLDDTDEPLGLSSGIRHSSAAPRQNNFPPPFGMEPPGFANPMPGFSGWGGPPHPFGTSPLPATNYMSGWPAGNSFGPNQPIRQSQPRSVSVRLMICQACVHLEGLNDDYFYPLRDIKGQVDQLNKSGQPVSEQEILDICETEGNTVNGGGTFEIRLEKHNTFSIRHTLDMPSKHSRHVGAPGEIGSPVIGSGSMARFPPPGFQ